MESHRPVRFSLFFLFLVLVTVHGQLMAASSFYDQNEEPQDPMHLYRHRSEHYVSGDEMKDQSSVRSEDAEFWINSAQAALADSIKYRNIEKVAKNIIFFLGDGMDIATITAARILKGEIEKLAFGEDGVLFFERFPNVAVSKTYCSDAQVADSACSATAFLCGTKANILTIGVKPSVTVGDCPAMMDKNNQVDSLLTWAQAAGKATGIVTTTRITHATPAGAYAHTAYRDWENDAVIKAMGSDPDKCDDIAEQLILNEPGTKINVIFGGGRREFFDNSVIDPETKMGGKRRDGKNLIEIWQQNKTDFGDRVKYVWNKAQFEALDVTNIDHVLGLFNYDHMNYVSEGQDEPSLTQMTKKAIEILSRRPQGFFLLVEGGRIDHAHHLGVAHRALLETIEFSNAVETAAALTKEDDTLILVTADHAHTMTISGYPDRGNSILNFGGVAEKIYGGDDLPYTTLSYANGPGYKKPDENGGRYNLTDDNITDINYQQPATVPIGAETHGGDNVVIFSRGPFSHFLRGVVQQSYIPHVLGYASQTGPGLKFRAEDYPDNGARVLSSTMGFWIVAAVAMATSFSAFCQ